MRRAFASASSERSVRRASGGTATTEAFRSAGVSGVVLIAGPWLLPHEEDVDRLHHHPHLIALLQAQVIEGVDGHDRGQVHRPVHPHRDLAHDRALLDRLHRTDDLVTRAVLHAGLPFRRRAYPAGPLEENWLAAAPGAGRYL